MPPGCSVDVERADEKKVGRSVVLAHRLDVALALAAGAAELSGQVLTVSGWVLGGAAAAPGIDVVLALVSAHEPNSSA